jgi:hypothetical protein
MRGSAKSGYGGTTGGGVREFSVRMRSARRPSVRDSVVGKEADRASSTQRSGPSCFGPVECVSERCDQPASKGSCGDVEKVVNVLRLSWCEFHPPARLASFSVTCSVIQRSSGLTHRKTTGRDISATVSSSCSAVDIAPSDSPDLPGRLPQCM